MSPRETHYSQIRTLLGRNVSVPTEPTTPPPLPLLPQVPHGKGPTVTAMDRELSPDLSRGWKGRCPYCLPQGTHRKGIKTVGLEGPLAPTFHGGRGDGRKLGTTALIVRPAPRCTTSLGFPQPCPSDFGKTGPRGRVQGPIVLLPPLLTRPNPLQDAWDPAERGPPHSIVPGVGVPRPGSCPWSYDKPSCSRSFLAPSRHQPVLRSVSDLEGSAWWLGVNVQRVFREN